MPTCMQWARGREEFGADARGNCRKRSNGTTQTTCARKEAHKQISGRNYLKKLSAQMSKNNPISQLRSRWARVQIFNMSEKYTLSRSAVIRNSFIKRAQDASSSQFFKSKEHTKGTGDDKTHAETTLSTSRYGRHALCCEVG